MKPYAIASASLLTDTDRLWLRLLQLLRAQLQIFLCSLGLLTLLYWRPTLPSQSDCLRQVLLSLLEAYFETKHAQSKQIWHTGYTITVYTLRLGCSLQSGTQLTSLHAQRTHVVKPLLSVHRPFCSCSNEVAPHSYSVINTKSQ